MSQGGGGRLKSAEKVSRIILMAPYPNLATKKKKNEIFWKFHLLCGIF